MNRSNIAVVIALLFAFTATGYMAGHTTAPAVASAPVTTNTTVSVPSAACLAAVRGLADIATVENNLIAAFLRGPVVDADPESQEYIRVTKNTAAIVAEANTCLAQGSVGS